MNQFLKKKNALFEINYTRAIQINRPWEILYLKDNKWMAILLCKMNTIYLSFLTNTKVSIVLHLHRFLAAYTKKSFIVCSIKTNTQYLSLGIYLSEWKASSYIKCTVTPR